MVDILKHVRRQQERIIRDLMPDRCQLVPNLGSFTISGTGVVSQTTPAPREWRNVSDIPCRIFISRSFRNEKLKDQPTVANEYILELPFDAPVEASDRVLINGRKYEIRKVKDQSAFDSVIELTIVEISTEYDEV